MINAMTSIKIYNPYGNVYYANADKSSVEFPITDQCERSAKLMGEDYVRLQFKLYDKITFDAFSFIRYNNQTFFLREQYIPKPNGTKKEDGGGVSSTYYTYDVKFVSVANMLDKHVCYRHVKVDTKEWYEPEININGNLSTMYVIVMGAIKRVAKEYEHLYYGYLLNTLYMNGMAADGINPNTDKVRLTAGTKLLTFNFSGAKIANVCTTIANNFTNDDKKDTEWYITEEHGELLDQTTMTLHFAKCVSNEVEQTFGDYVKEDKGAYAFAHPYTTGGLKRVEYAQEWSGVTNTIVPFGSDRNMSGQSVKGIDEITNMQSTFGKRLRLDIYDKEGNPMKYKVYDLEGGEHEIEVDSRGGIRNNFVNTGIEEVKFFDDVYPQGHFRVEKVDIKNKRQDGETVPEYTITALPIDSNGNVIDKEDLAPIGSTTKGNGFYPIRIEEGTTLSVRFESGMLAGREFEIANKSHKDYDRPTYSMKFTIVADGSIEDGTLIPSGNFRPYGDLSTQTAEKAPSGVGDTFALFNMKMPDVYVEQAKQELAQKAFEELLKIQTTRPEVKCSTDPTNFNGDIAFGNVINVESELFNTEGYTFHSRVISYSYKLTKTTDVQFSLASAIMQGTLSSMNDLIADVTNATGGLEQRAVNLSRRAWRDASEMAEMLDSMRTEMMLVGEEKYQFTFTSAIECNNVSNKFAGLKIGYGSLQHTQEPYISYSNNGWWEISGQTLTKDEVGQPLDSAKAYYLYAKVANTTGVPAEMVLSENAYSTDVDTNTEYLLLGILSSEFEGQRVFNRTNGFSSIAGGTITTEQIQDAGRNLIIDFQSNPPRILARNGAEIIGNIRFLSSDGKSQTLLEHLNNGIGGKNLLYSTSFECEYRATQTVRFAKIYDLEAGKKYVASYGKFENNAGGATNEAFNGVCLVVAQSPALANVESVVKFGEAFEVNGNGRFLYIAWASYDYVNYDKGNSYPTTETATDFTQYLDQVMLQEGEIATAFQPSIDEELEEIEQLQNDFQESLDKINNDEYFSIAEKKIIRTNWEAISGAISTSTAPTYESLNGSYGEAYKAAGTAISVTALTTAFSNLRAFLDTNELYANSDRNWGTSGRSNMAGYFTAYYNAEKALWENINKAYADSKIVDTSKYDYLIDVLKKGSSEIDGGLFLTQVLGLKDSDDVTITAGMSGLKEDNVLIWGGGSYDEAVNAASPDNDFHVGENKTGRQITSLIKKDGTSKLGIFKISDTQAIVKTNQGEVLVDNDEGISCRRAEQSKPVVIVTPKELKSIDTLRSEGAPKSGGGTVEAIFEDISDMIYTSGEHILYSPTITRRFFVGAGGTIKVSGQVMISEVKLSHPTNASVGDQDKDGIYCNVFDDEGNRIASGFASQDARAVFKCTVDKAGYYTLTMSAGVFVDVTGVDIDDAGHGLSVIIKFLDYVVGMENEPATYADYSYTYTEANKQTVMAYKGLFSYQGETAYLYYKDGVGFECRMGGVIFKISTDGIVLDGLPNSAVGLVAGSLYTEGDYIKIVGNRE